jgi:hypothetical protein
VGSRARLDAVEKRKHLPAGTRTLIPLLSNLYVVVMGINFYGANRDVMNFL